MIKCKEGFKFKGGLFFIWGVDVIFECKLVELINLIVVFFWKDLEKLVEKDEGFLRVFV